MAPTLPRIDLRMEDLERLVDRTRHTPLTEGEHATLKAAIDTLGYLAHLVDQKGTTLDGLRQLLFGATTEKTRDVLARAGVDPPPAPRAPRDDEPDCDAGGHGRHGAAAYTGARQVPVPHAQLHHGDRCPSCTGTVYRQRDPRMLIRLVGRSFVLCATVPHWGYRCPGCGGTFTPAPATLPAIVSDGGSAPAAGPARHGRRSGIARVRVILSGGIMCLCRSAANPVGRSPERGNIVRTAAAQCSPRRLNIPHTLRPNAYGSQSSASHTTKIRFGRCFGGAGIVESHYIANRTIRLTPTR